MTITVQGPNNVTIQFPAGTDAATVERVMRQAAGMEPMDAPKPDAPGALMSGVLGASQGLTLGFGDEIEGGARALYNKLTGDSRSFGELYDESVKIPRARNAAAKEANPIAFGVGEFGGGVALPGGLARVGVRGALSAAAGRGLGARSVAGAKEGAAYGAAYGAGTAEGGVSDRLTGAASGAATGAAIGAAMPGAIDLVSGVGRAIAAPIRGAFRPAEHAATKLGEAIYRDMPHAATASPQQRFAERFQNMSEANPAAMLMDAGGENVRGLMRAAANVPNTAREVARRRVDARQATQYKRIEDDLAKGFKEGRNYYDSIDEIAERMERAGANVIAPALKTPTPMTPQLQGVLDRPTMRELTEVIGRKIADEGAPIGLETRTTLLHRIKIELDDQIGQSIRAEKMGQRPQAGWDTRTLTILKRDLLNAIDNVTYKRGLQLYASQAQLKNAAEDGFETFTKMAPEEITRRLREFDTNVERQFFRMGAMRALVDKVRQGNVNRDRTDGVFSSPEIQLKLEAVMPDRQSLRAFQKQLVIEAKFADTRKALQGNSTSAKQLAEGEQAGKESQVVTSIANAAMGGWQSKINALGQIGNRFTGLTPQTSGALLRLGMSKDPQLVDGLMQRSIERARQTPIRRAERAQQSTAGLAALLAGQ